MSSLAATRIHYYFFDDILRRLLFGLTTFILMTLISKHASMGA